MEQELCTNIKESLRGIKELGAGNSIFSLFLFCYNFLISARFRFVNRLRRSKNVSPGLYEFLHLQILSHPLCSSVCVCA